MTIASKKAHIIKLQIKNTIPFIYDHFRLDLESNEKIIYGTSN
jgi:hypothetical protein